MYLSYFGIRVTDLSRSLEFYTEHFGLRPREGSEIATDEPEKEASVLLVDPISRQRLELNYYPEGSPYAVPFVSGEAWDHLAFHVDDLPHFLEELIAHGVRPEKMAHFEGPILVTPTFRVAYIRDPDGNQIELYDTPGAPATPFRPEEY